MRFIFEYRLKNLLHAIFSQSEIERDVTHNGVVYEYFIRDYNLLIDSRNVDASSRQVLAHLHGHRYLHIPRDIDQARTDILAAISSFKILESPDGLPTILSPRFHGDAGWDIITSENIVCKARSCVDIPSDLFIEMPHQLYGIVHARSSTSKRGLLVLPGVIDPSYRGRIYAMTYNLTDSDICISKGDRVAQMLFFERAPGLYMTTAQILAPSDRSDKGFGSTGKGINDTE